MDICIDFDGTCVTHEFPDVGKNIGAASVLKQLVENNHNLILFTMRSNVDDPSSDDPTIVKKSGNFLDDAVAWFAENDIPLYGIQKNPSQEKWTSSNKAYGQLYIDDAALGCPLTYNADLSDRPFVDWLGVEFLLRQSGVIL